MKELAVEDVRGPLAPHTALPNSHTLAPRSPGFVSCAPCGTDTAYVRCVVLHTLRGTDAAGLAQRVRY
eukprot:2728200-Rhodomonas_salina.1